EFIGTLNRQSNLAVERANDQTQFFPLHSLRSPRFTHLPPHPQQRLGLHRATQVAGQRTESNLHVSV
ncbi:MAG: hypothetical protein R3C02_13435, partial [Planctomycetaceae bacterium]